MGINMGDTLKLILKVALWTLLGTVIFLLVSMLFHYLVREIMEGLKLPEWLPTLPLSFVAIFAYFVLPKRWLKLNFLMKFSRSRLIKAPMKTVWDTLYLSERDDYYLAGIDTVEADSSDPKKFRYVFSPLLNDLEQKKPTTVDVRITDVKKYEYFAYDYDHKPSANLMMKSIVLSEKLFEQTNEGVVVTLTEHIKGISMFTFIMFMWRHPCQDALIQLAARCEGSPDTSWAGKMMARMRAREAGRPIPNDNTLIVGATILAVPTLLLYFLLWGLIKIINPV